MRNRTNLIAVLAIVALLAVGGVIAIVVTANRDEPATSAEAPGADAKRAAARDAAIADGTTAATTLNTLDAADIEKDLDRWESVATGALLDELKNNRAQFTQRLREAGTKTTAKVLVAGLAEFDPDKGKARLLAAVVVNVTGPDAPSEKRLRLAVSLTRTKGGWKADGVEQA